MLEKLVMKIKLHSETVLSDLEKAPAGYRNEPRDAQGFSNDSLLVQKHFQLHILNLEIDL